jgi:ATP-dependent Lon protease
MTRDKNTKSSKISFNKKQEEKKKRTIKSDDDSSDNSADEHSSTESDEEQMNVHEYRKLLSEIFPSKHMSKKVKSGEKIKKLMEKMREDSEDSEDDEVKESKESKEPKEKITKKSKESRKQKVKSLKKKQQPKKKKDEDSESDSTDDDEDEVVKPSSGKFNIIFTIGQKGDDYDDDDDDDEWDDDYDDEDDDDDDYDEDENEDDEVSTDSDSSDDNDDENEEEEEWVTDDDEEEPDESLLKRKRSLRSSSKKSNKLKSTNPNKSAEEESKVQVQEILTQENKGNETILEELKLLYSKNTKNAMIKQCIDLCEEEIAKSKKKAEKKAKKQKDKHLRIFKRVIREKNNMNDFTFFEKMGCEEQRKIIKEVREVNKVIRIEKPYRMTLLESNIPPLFKAAAMKKISSLRHMEPGSGEFYKIKNWVDTFMRIPFGKYETLPVNIKDGVEPCHAFMESAKNTLDKAVYGLNDAKMQIMQMLGQLITNPNAIGTAIAIKGPMGTGKTTLVKEGISKILNRPFAFIALGGATDSSFLEGHSYTYEGSVWGKIVQILIDSKCMNPVIYFDELDKISDTAKGEEIAGILTHLTDTSQNSQFHDKYFAEVDFDLSKCLFIFSYNDENKVNPILRDRMYRIQTKGYDRKQKTVICNQYLIPRIQEQVLFNDGDIIMPEEVIHYVIETHCNKEDGVRNMKRCLEIIHTKLNLYRLMKPGSNLFEEDMSLEVSFPFTVTKQIVDKLIKKERDDNYALSGMYL